MASTSQKFAENERAIISNFFTEKVPQALRSKNPPDPSSPTETTCIAFAKALLNDADDISPAENQGSNSFTLTCPSRSSIVQFRLAPLDLSILERANQIHGDLVPKLRFIPDFPLPVYTSTLIPGKPHILQPFPKPEEGAAAAATAATFPLQREKTTVADLGRFVAQAAWHADDAAARGGWSPSGSTGSAYDSFDRLLRNESLAALAPELREVVAAIRPKLHLLESLPGVLTHNDFAQINILVDEESGCVTGAVNFESARVETFGMCIWGLYECFFGSMEGGRWGFYDMPAVEVEGAQGRTVREVLELAFWDALWENTPPSLRREEAEEAVKVALSVGVVARYFIRGMLDKIDMSLRVHRLSLEYAKGILPQICK